MVSPILLSVWFAWCLVFVSGADTHYSCRCWVGKEWDVSTIHILGDILSGCVTQDPRVGPMGACAIHPTHSLVPRPLPDFISQLWRKMRDKIWEWPGDEATLLILFAWSCLEYGLNGIWCSFQGSWYVLILLVLGWGRVGRKHTFWVTHSTPLGDTLYPPAPG